MKKQKRLRETCPGSYRVPVLIRYPFGGCPVCRRETRLIQGNELVGKHAVPEREVNDD